jgi:D-hexose-6-phosphate mutarotase
LYGTIEVIPLKRLIGYEDLYRESNNVSCLKAGMVKRICFRLYEDFSFITYDIDGGFKKYINVEDDLSIEHKDRVSLSFHTMYELKDSVVIEIAGVKREATVDSIEVNWMVDQYIVNYGIKDRTETVYYGISEELLIKWNR